MQDQLGKHRLGDAAAIGEAEGYLELLATMLFGNCGFVPVLGCRLGAFCGESSASHGCGHCV